MLEQTCLREDCKGVAAAELTDALPSLGRHPKRDALQRLDPDSPRHFEAPPADVGAGSRRCDDLPIDEVGETRARLANDKLD